MSSVGECSNISRRTSSVQVKFRRILGGFVVCSVAILAIIIVPGAATADVGSTSEFTPDLWGPGNDTAARPRSRASSRSAARQAVAVDDDDEDRPVARRTRSASLPTLNRVKPRGVRVAALGRSAIAPETSAARTAVKRLTPSRSAQGRTRVAALGSSPTVSRIPQASLTGGSIAWRANSGCLAGNLRSLVASISSNYGPLTVNSTCRSRTHNRRVGGASKSWHLTGNAVDFRMRGNIRGAIALLSGHGGGMKHYGGGRFHIDNGPRRRF